MDCKSKSFSNVIVSEVSVDDFNKVIEKYDSSENKYKKILNNLELILEGQEVTQKDLQLGFIGLAKQNSELIDLNKELTQQLEIVMSELNVMKKERAEKAARREKWSK